MKKTLLSLLTITAFGFGFAQSDILAVSGSDAKKIDFQDFRFLDAKKGSEKLIANKNSEIPEQVVGMTYDAKNHKLIFIGMYNPDVYSYDLQSGEFVRIYASGMAYSKCALKEQFSRMGTASNGVTYALNNSSTQLLEIKPIKNGYAVKELGSISADVALDDYKFYGGDLISDDSGHLYLISAYSKVLKINPKNLSATFMGAVDGLEDGFTTNGSAVMADGKILLSNAQGKGFYTLDFNNLKAEKFNGTYTSPIYDLASPYVIKDTNAMVASNSYMSIYPTRVTERKISVSVNSKLEGMGQILIYDLAGNQLIESKMNLENVQNVKSLTLNNLSPGNYYLKVIDYKGNELINEKFILLR